MHALRLFFVANSHTTIGTRLQREHQGRRSFSDQLKLYECRDHRGLLCLLSTWLCLSKRCVGLSEGRAVSQLPSTLVPLTEHDMDRYSNVDPPVANAIAAGVSRGILDFVFSYDIACKYSVHFFERIKAALPGKDPLFPSSASLAFENGLVFITWLIGKFHLAGHKEECSKKYSFNYNSLVGRMSGELVETIWAAFNWLKYQTREMGPGPRIETLSDAMNFWNWMKVIKMGKLPSRVPPFATPADVPPVFCFRDSPLFHHILNSR